MGNSTGYNLRDFYNGITKANNPLYSYQFIAEFRGSAKLEEWGITGGKDEKNISYFFKSATIPGYTLETGKMTYLGTEFRLPGVQKFNHSWTATLLLEQNFTAYKAFRRWQEEISSLYRDGGGDKSVPDAQMVLSVLDSNGVEAVSSVVLEGVWVSKVGNIPLAYANGGGNTPDLSIEFRYQYNYLDPNFDRSNDPLKA